jgi:hypothetical protein
VTIIRRGTQEESPFLRHLTASRHPHHGAATLTRFRLNGADGPDLVPTTGFVEPDRLDHSPVLANA